MPSVIYTPATYSDSSFSFTADTEYTSILRSSSDGDTRPEPSHQALHIHAQKQIRRTTSPANAQTNIRHRRYKRQLQHARPQQEEIPPIFDPLPLHEEFRAEHTYNSDYYTRRQSGGRAEPFSRDYSGDNADRRRPEDHGCLPGVAREVSRRKGKEPAAGGAFLLAGPEEGEARKSVSSSSEGFFGLDGAQDEGKDLQDRGKAGDRGLSVRDRVAALEARGKKDEKKGTARAVQPPPVNKFEDVAKYSKAPIMYPLHVKKFVRRTSSGTPLRPETPLYRSIPDDEPLIHAPMPTRSFPMLKTPAETPKVMEAPKADPAIPIHQPKTRPQGITPPSFLHGTRTNCVRHGRKPELAGSMYMVAKTRSDASKSGAVASDACPDCVAELAIKRRELLGGGVTGVKRPIVKPRTSVSSMFGEPSPPAVKPRTLIRNSSGQESDDDGLVVVKDLGKGLDAVIVEHHGDLRRVVVNARHGQPTIETMQRLSRELARVSSSIAFASVRPSGSSVAVPEHANRDPAVLTDTTSRTREVRTSSVPELLDLIDQAANEIHSNTGRIAEHYVDRRDFAEKDRRQSLLLNDKFEELRAHDTSPIQRLVSRQSMDDHLRAMREHLANGARENSGQSAASIAPSTCQRPSRQSTSSNRTPEPAQIARPTSNIPKLMKTKPTLPLAVSKTPNVSPSQTPPPQHPTVYHAAKLHEGHIKGTPATLPTPKSHEEPAHHNGFSSFLNPFHHQNPPTSSPQKPLVSVPPSPQTVPAAIPQIKPPPVTPTKALTSNLPVPVRQDSPDLPPGAPPQPIIAHPNPYHHAPHTPVSINKAAYADPKLREQQQVIRNAMRMDKNKAQEAAAAMEREVRRKRSLPVREGARKGLLG